MASNTERPVPVPPEPVLCPAADFRVDVGLLAGSVEELTFGGLPETVVVEFEVPLGEVGGGVSEAVTRKPEVARIGGSPA